jgi:hypothetical protein
MTAAADTRSEDVHVSLVLPASLAQAIREKATKNERTFSAEMRVAARRHVETTEQRGARNDDLRP